MHRKSGNSCLLETCPADGNLIAHGIVEDIYDELTNNNSRYDAGEHLLADQPNISCRDNPTVKGKLGFNAVSMVSKNQTSSHVPYDQATSGSDVPSISVIQKSQPCMHIGLGLKKEAVESNSYLLYQRPTTVFPEIKSIHGEEDQAGSHYELDGDEMPHNELKGLLQLVGFYSHPLPILSLILRRHGSEIYLCVQCGLLVDELRTLFLYKLPVEAPRIGCPSFIGQTSFLPPISSPSLGGVSCTWVL